MYTISVKRDFIARHYLTGGNWGPENNPHSHHYVIELQLDGKVLDQNGFLVDIVDIEFALDKTVQRFHDQTLNEQKAFNGTNPSLENFAKLICLDMVTQIQAPNIQAVTVKLWENEIAWASFRIVR
jgi:6-pyruvoyltetrahydropterin/6-carboxytetrahydropterin synthase